MSQINNDLLLDKLKTNYTFTDIQELYDYLKKRDTFNFPTLKTDLFSASPLQKYAKYTGYDAVWIRDNVYIAYAHYIRGENDIVKNCITALMSWLKKQKFRFEKIIRQGYAPQNQMDRPHIRFDGEKLEEIDENWNHAQNDALGYFLWFYCKLTIEGELRPDPDDMEMLAILGYYFYAVTFWQDEESGHWEEPPKIEASSIGVVIAGLKQLKQLLSEKSSLFLSCQYENEPVTLEFLSELIQTGYEALNRILPFECIQEEKDKNRKYDTALLFLIYPLNVVSEGMENLILSNAIGHLQGNYGIRRYLGDAFWCRDYKDIPEEIRTGISIKREKWFEEHGRELRVGEEAQWCIFDPIISAIFGVKYQRTGQKIYLAMQTKYLNRSLGHITHEFKCPELYYLQNDKYIPNDVVPLLWTQANLSVALKKIEENLG